MDEIRTEKQHTIAKISRGIKYLIFSIVFMIIVVGGLLYIISNFDLKNPEIEKLFLYYMIPFLVAMVLLLISIERMAKALKKDIRAGIFLSFIVFPIILLFAALYFLSIAIFQIMKLKLSKDAEQFSAAGSPGQAFLNNRAE